MYARRRESDGVSGRCPDLSQQSNKIWVSCGTWGGVKSITHLNPEGSNTPNKRPRRQADPVPCRQSWGREGSGPLPFRGSGPCPHRLSPGVLESFRGGPGAIRRSGGLKTGLGLHRDREGLPASRSEGRELSNRPSIGPGPRVLGASFLLRPRPPSAWSGPTGALLRARPRG